MQIDLIDALQLVLLFALGITIFVKLSRLEINLGERIATVDTRLQKHMANYFGGNVVITQGIDSLCKLVQGRFSLLNENPKEVKLFPLETESNSNQWD